MPLRITWSREETEMNGYLPTIRHITGNVIPDNPYNDYTY